MATLTTATPRNADPVELRRALDTVDFFAGLVEAASLNRMAIAARGTNIPVVIVAGFLGAGKTTLMRHVLTADHGMKIAAMVNDFAALNIDAALIAEVSGDVTALANGCVCCSLSGGIARDLTGIIDRPEPLDAVLIEASGVSDPAGIALVAGTLCGISLDCIVTVVDAAENPAQTDWQGLLARQVAPANLVLLNKTDLVDAKHVSVCLDQAIFNVRFRSCLKGQPAFASDRPVRGLGKSEPEMRQTLAFFRMHHVYLYRQPIKR